MATEVAQFLHLARPSTVAPLSQSSLATSPITVNIHPQAALSILDHAVRHGADSAAAAENKTTSTARVIGALVGTRSEDGSEVEVRSCFAIPHTETEDQVEVDVDYQKHMLELTLKASPRETLLGWYTTSLELNSFSALIQNFFASQETGTFPHPAVHLTMSTTPGQTIDARCYVSAPIALNQERAAESCVFIQVPHKILYGDASERSALESILSARDDPTRSTVVPSDIESLARSLDTTLDHLTRVSDWVNSVLDEEVEPNHAVGQYLMNALSLTPNVSAEQIDRDFSSHLQDVLMVSYLANTIRTQIDLSQRLATQAVFSPADAKDDGEEGTGNAASSAAHSTTNPSGTNNNQQNGFQPRNRRYNNNNNNNNRGPRNFQNNRQQYQQRNQQNTPSSQSKPEAKDQEAK